MDTWTDERVVAATGKYEPPAIIALGTLQELTQGNSTNTNPDNSALKGITPAVSV